MYQRVKKQFATIRISRFVGLIIGREDIVAQKLLLILLR